MAVTRDPRFFASPRRNFVHRRLKSTSSQYAGLCRSVEGLEERLLLTLTSTEQTDVELHATDTYFQYLAEHDVTAVSEGDLVTGNNWSRALLHYSFDREMLAVIDVNLEYEYTRAQPIGGVEPNRSNVYYIPALALDNTESVLWATHPEVLFYNGLTADPDWSTSYTAEQRLSPGDYRFNVNTQSVVVAGRDRRRGYEFGTGESLQTRSEFNVRFVDLDLPNIKVTDLSFDSTNSRVHYEYQIEENALDEPASLRFYLADDDAVQSQPSSGLSLKDVCHTEHLHHVSTETEVGTYAGSVSLAELGLGDYSVNLVLLADSEELIEERSESDNHGLTVIERGVTIESLAWNQVDTIDGRPQYDGVNVTYKIDGQLGSDTPISFYWSEDASYSSDDSQITHNPMSSTPGEDTQIVVHAGVEPMTSTTVTIPSTHFRHPLGLHKYLIARAEVPGIPEGHCASQQKGHDLILVENPVAFDLSGGQIDVLLGQAYQATFTARNFGPVPVEAYVEWRFAPRDVVVLPTDEEHTLNGSLIPDSESVMTFYPTREVKIAEEEISHVWPWIKEDESPWEDRLSKLGDAISARTVLGNLPDAWKELLNIKVKPSLTALFSDVSGVKDLTELSIDMLKYVNHVPRVHITHSAIVSPLIHNDLVDNIQNPDSYAQRQIVARVKEGKTEALAYWVMKSAAVKFPVVPFVKGVLGKAVGATGEVLGAYSSSLGGQILGIKRTWDDVIDPPDSDFRTFVRPDTSTLPPEVASLDDGLGRKLAARLNLLSELELAIGKSIDKSDGAKIGSDHFWEAEHLTVASAQANRLAFDTASTAVLESFLIPVMRLSASSSDVWSLLQETPTAPELQSALEQSGMSDAEIDAFVFNLRQLSTEYLDFDERGVERRLGAMVAAERSMVLLRQAIDLRTGSLGLARQEVSEADVNRLSGMKDDLESRLLQRSFSPRDMELAKSLISVARMICLETNNFEAIREYLDAGYLGMAEIQAVVNGADGLVALINSLSENELIGASLHSQLGTWMGEVESELAAGDWANVVATVAEIKQAIESDDFDGSEDARKELGDAIAYFDLLATYPSQPETVELDSLMADIDVTQYHSRVPWLQGVEIAQEDISMIPGSSIKVTATTPASQAEIRISDAKGLVIEGDELSLDGDLVAVVEGVGTTSLEIQPLSITSSDVIDLIFGSLEYVAPTESRVGIDHVLTLGITGNGGTASEYSTSVTFGESPSPPGITIIETSDETIVHETGTTDTFEVVLDSPPFSSVTLKVASSDTTEFDVSPKLLTFTRDNWSSPQSVTVTGHADDEFADGNQTTNAEVSVDANSVDSSYEGTAPADVAVVNQSHSNYESFTIERMGRVSDYVNVNAPPFSDIEVRDSDGTVVSPAIDVDSNGNGRVSLAGLPQGSYEVWFNGDPNEVVLTPGDRFGTESGAPSVAALDIDENGGEFQFATDGILLLAYSLGSRGADLASFSGIGSGRSGEEIGRTIDQLADALDIDGDGVFTFANDGIIFLAHALGTRGNDLESFRSSRATRSGERIGDRIQGLLSFGHARLETPSRQESDSGISVVVEFSWPSETKDGQSSDSVGSIAQLNERGAPPKSFSADHITETEWYQEELAEEAQHGLSGSNTDFEGRDGLFADANVLIDLLVESVTAG